jgi:hypothetical protein
MTRPIKIAFRALVGKAISVHVGQENECGNAEFFVRDPEEVYCLLIKIKRQFYPSSISDRNTYVERLAEVEERELPPA